MSKQEARAAADHRVVGASAALGGDGRSLASYAKEHGLAAVGDVSLARRIDPRRALAAKSQPRQRPTSRRLRTFRCALPASR